MRYHVAFMCMTLVALVACSSDKPRPLDVDYQATRLKSVRGETVQSANSAERDLAVAKAKVKELQQLRDQAEYRATQAETLAAQCKKKTRGMAK